jgi:transposase-like protein
MEPVPPCQPRRRRFFEPEFKAEIVRLIVDRGGVVDGEHVVHARPILGRQVGDARLRRFSKASTGARPSRGERSRG